MADVRWVGGAGAVAQVSALTVSAGAGLAPDQKFILNVLNESGNVQKTITYTTTASDTTITTVIDGLAAAWNGSGFPEMGEAIASNSDPEIIFTGATPGVPFNVSGVNGDASAMVPNATKETTPTGPNWLNNGLNYSSGALPAASDNLFFQGEGPAVLYGLDALNAIALNGVTIDRRFRSQIGLTPENPQGYPEYRPTRIELNITGTLTIGRGNGSGIPWLNADMQGQGTRIDLISSGGSLARDLYAVQITNTTAGNLYTWGGTIDLNREAGKSGTFTNIFRNGGTIRAWAGTTLTQEISTGGTLRIEGLSAGNYIARGGTIDVGTGDLTDVQLLGGNLRYFGAGTLTKIEINDPQSTCDLGGTLETVNITEFLGLRGRWKDPNLIAGLPANVQLGKDVVFSE